MPTIPTFSILLTCYECPEAVRKWLKLLLDSDFVRMIGACSSVLIIDTGSGRETHLEMQKICDDGYAAILQAGKRGRLPPLGLLWLDTRKWREVAGGVCQRVMGGECDVRGAVLGMNVGLDVLTGELAGDVLQYSTVGHCWSERYFERMLAWHAGNERVLVQPRQYEVIARERSWRDRGMMSPFPLGRGAGFGGRNVGAGDIVIEATGMPDFSVRRKWVEQVGGWDEDYLCWGMPDIDLCVRLTGKLDDGAPAEQYWKDWHADVGGGGRIGVGRCGLVREGVGSLAPAGANLLPPRFDGLGLEFVRPMEAEYYSLVKNDYAGHVADGDEKRWRGAMLGMKVFFEKWGSVGRGRGSEWEGGLWEELRGVEVPWRVTWRGV